MSASCRENCCGEVMVPRGVGRQRVARAKCRLLGFRSKGENRFPQRRAVNRDARADGEVRAHQLGALRPVQVDHLVAVLDPEVHGFTVAPGQLLHERAHDLFDFQPIDQAHAHFEEGHGQPVAGPARLGHQAQVPQRQQRPVADAAVDFQLGGDLGEGQGPPPGQEVDDLDPLLQGPDSIILCLWICSAHAGPAVWCRECHPSHDPWGRRRGRASQNWIDKLTRLSYLNQIQPYLIRIQQARQ